jgi:hypothetical protein
VASRSPTPSKRSAVASFGGCACSGLSTRRYQQSGEKYDNGVIHCGMGLLCQAQSEDYSQVVSSSAIACCHACTAHHDVALNCIGQVHVPLIACRACSPLQMSSLTASCSMSVAVKKVMMATANARLVLFVFHSTRTTPSAVIFERALWISHAQ